MIEFDIILEPPFFYNGPPAFFKWKHYKDGHVHVTITLRQLKCICDEFMFTPEDYIHMLEHEIVEGVAMSVTFESKIFTKDIKWKGNGFNYIFSKGRITRKNHKCKFATMKMRFG